MPMRSLTARGFFWPVFTGAMGTGLLAARISGSLRAGSTEMGGDLIDVVEDCGPSECRLVPARAGPVGAKKPGPDYEREIAAAGAARRMSEVKQHGVQQRPELAPAAHPFIATLQRPDVFVVVCQPLTRTCGNPDFRGSSCAGMRRFWTNGQQTGSAR